MFICCVSMLCVSINARLVFIHLVDSKMSSASADEKDAYKYATEKRKVSESEATATKTENSSQSVAVPVSSIMATLEQFLYEMKPTGDGADAAEKQAREYAFQVYHINKFVAKHEPKAEMRFSFSPAEKPAAAATS